MFKGVLPALVTPFKEDLEVDFKGLERNLEYLEKHVDGVVPSGTTGESATMSYEEHIQVVKHVVEVANVPVIGGAGSNSTKEALYMGKEVEKAGVDAAMFVTPYYNKPNQEGLYQHYKAIAEAVSIPILIYNVPGRTGINITADTVERLSVIDNIVGIKEASGNLRQVSEMIKRTRDKDFVLLSGEDFFTYPILTMGGSGVISVTANVAPHIMQEMYTAYQNKDIEKALEAHFKLVPLYSAMFIDTNPIPVKKSLNLMGLAAGKPRLPLIELDEEKTQKVKTVLQSLDLL
ncbi:MAG: 4-hydroxy-tetrahydrodipicolinate synthase [Archaeoglobaceae archaeon]